MWVILCILRIDAIEQTADIVINHSYSLFNVWRKNHLNVMNFKSLIITVGCGSHILLPRKLKISFLEVNLYSCFIIKGVHSFLPFCLCMIPRYYDKLPWMINGDPTKSNAFHKIAWHDIEYIENGEITNQGVKVEPRLDYPSKVKGAKKSTQSWWKMTR